MLALKYSLLVEVGLPACVGRYVATRKNGPFPMHVCLLCWVNNI